MSWLAVFAAVQAVGSLARGAAEAEAQRANAQVALADAAAAREAAEFEAAQVTRSGERLLARQRAIYGASGIDPGTGSPLEVAADTAAEIALDVAAIRYGGAVKSAREETRAKLHQRAAKDALASGVFDALGAGANYFGATFKGTSETPSFAELQRRTKGYAGGVGF
jgi:hypothetical protein